MKTYKQMYNELTRKMSSLRKIHEITVEENNLRAQVLLNEHMFDPIKYYKTHEKLIVAIEALNAIMSISFSDKSFSDNRYLIAKEALLQIGKIDE